MNRPNAPIDLPVGPKPGWELDHSEEGEHSSISDSCVIFHSLRQSREKWLSSTFPRFSTKARSGKGLDVGPPPHTIQNRGKCDLEIGPHIFPETVFYEVHYLPPPGPAPSYGYQPSNGNSWQASSPYNQPYLPYTKPPNTSQVHQDTQSGGSSSSVNPQHGSSPVISSLDTVTTITPALINQVNSAASSNPILANLLQLAAAGKATPEQLKTLGLLIQSLATPEGTHVSSPSVPEPNVSLPPSTVRTYVPAPIKQFDLVIEFRETPSERWVFPRGIIICEKIIDAPTTDATYHTIIKARVPFDVPSVPGSTVQPSATNTSPSTQEQSSTVAVFRMRKTPLAVWDTISRWAGNEEKLQQNKKLLELSEKKEREYLAYYLAPGPLLSQLQTAVAPNFTMKPLRTGPSHPRAKRKSTAQRKLDATTLQSDTTEVPTTQSTVPKRRRVSQAAKKSTTPVPIHCISCKQADVPLILGGRFCRQCVESGRTTQPYSYSHSPVNVNPSVEGATPQQTPAPTSTIPAPFIHSSLSAAPITSHENKPQ